VAVTRPSRAARKKLDFDSIVDVVAPGGRFKNAHTAPRLSANDIKMPPCKPPPIVHLSGAQSSPPYTFSAVASSICTPHATANGIDCTSTSLSIAATVTMSELGVQIPKSGYAKPMTGTSVVNDDSPTAAPADGGSLRSTWPIHRKQALQLFGWYVALVGVWTGIGLLLTGPLENTAITRTDQRIAEWFIDHRTSTWNTLSLWGSHLAETWVKVLVTLIIVGVMIKVWRRWYEALVVAVALILEAASFVTITTIVGRDRPPPPRLDESPIGSSFPSGHIAAAVAYAAIAVVVFWHTRNRIARTVAVVVCVVVPVIVGLSRMYRGMHFLSDVIAGVVLGAAAVVVTVMVLRRSPEAERLAAE